MSNRVWLRDVKRERINRRSTTLRVTRRYAVECPTPRNEDTLYEVLTMMRAGGMLINQRKKRVPPQDTTALLEEVKKAYASIALPARTTMRRGLQQRPTGPKATAA